jgi:hypothetical protein
MFRGLVITAITCISFSTVAQVVVDDFNDIYPSQTTLGWNCGVGAHTGYWFGFNENGSGENKPGASIMTPNFINNEFKAAHVKQGPDGSNCIHISYALSATLTSPFAAIGFNIYTNQKPSIDLSSMTSLTFMAKGTGSIRIKFTSLKVKGYGDGNNWGEMGTDVKLNADWTKHTITTDKIVPQLYSPQATEKLTWDQCKAGILAIHIQTAPTSKGGDAIDLSIDDIIMNGVTPQTFGGDWSEVQHFTPIQTNHQGLSLSSHNGNILYSSSQTHNVTIDLYSPSGSFVKRVLSAPVSNARIQAKVPSGFYVCKVAAEGKMATVPVMLSK